MAVAVEASPRRYCSARFCHGWIWRGQYGLRARGHVYGDDPARLDCGAVRSCRAGKRHQRRPPGVLRRRHRLRSRGLCCRMSRQVLRSTAAAASWISRTRTGLSYRVAFAGPYEYDVSVCFSLHELAGSISRCYKGDIQH